MIRILIEKEVTVRELTSGSWDILHKSGDGEEKRGYTPEREKTVVKNVKVLEQFVSDDLDIPAVIAVINGLQKPPESLGWAKHNRVIDDVMYIHGNEYIVVKNAHAFIGVREVVLRDPPHMDVCARIPIVPFSPESVRMNWLKIASGELAPSWVKGMRVESLRWAGDKP